MVQIEHGYLHRALVCCRCHIRAARRLTALMVTTWWSSAAWVQCAVWCHTDIQASWTRSCPLAHFPSLDNYLPVYPIKLSKHASTVDSVDTALSIVNCVLYAICSIQIFSTVCSALCTTFITAWSLLIVATLPNVRPHNTADIWIWTSYFDEQIKLQVDINRNSK